MNCATGSAAVDGALQGLMQRETNQAGLNSTDAVLTDWLERHGHDSGQRRTLASRLLEALEALERADITTIHGFCRRTLRRQALQERTGPGTQPDDDPQTLAQDVAHDLWREHVLGLAPADLAGLLKAGLNTDALTHAAATPRWRLRGEHRLRCRADRAGAAPG